MIRYLIKLTVTPVRNVDDEAGTYYIGRDFRFASEKNMPPLQYAYKYSFKTFTDAKEFCELRPFKGEIKECFDPFFYKVTHEVVAHEVEDNKLI